MRLVLFVLHRCFLVQQFPCPSDSQRELPTRWMLSLNSRLAEVLLTRKTLDFKARAFWSLLVPVTPTPAPFPSSCSTLLTLNRWRTWPGQLRSSHCHSHMAAVCHTFRGLWNLLPLFSLSRQCPLASCSDLLLWYTQTES